VRRAQGESRGEYRDARERGQGGRDVDVGVLDGGRLGRLRGRGSGKEEVMGEEEAVRERLE